MPSELYNVIDALSREKGIDPQIVVSAVEDAIVVATRKYYKTQENLRAVLDRESGHIRAYAVKQIVGTRRGSSRSEWPDHARRRTQVQCRGRSRRRVADREADGRSRTHRRAIGEAGHLPESARGRARHGLQRVHQPRRRNRQCHRQADRRAGFDFRCRQGRSPHVQERAIAAGVVCAGRARAGCDRAGREGFQGTAGGGFACRSRTWSVICFKPRFPRFTTGPS